MSAWHRIFVIAAAGGAIAVAVTIASTSPAATRSSAPMTETQLLSIAQAAAAGMGDSTPTLIEHSEGTRSAANLVASGEVVNTNSDQDSYLIAERGDFTASNVPRPAGSSAPPTGFRLASGRRERLDRPV